MHGVRLRVGADGLVIPPHRADAFPDPGEDFPGPIELRRNQAVRWTLTEGDVLKLTGVVAAEFPDDAGSEDEIPY